MLPGLLLLLSGPDRLVAGFHPECSRLYPSRSPSLPSTNTKGDLRDRADRLRLHDHMSHRAVSRLRSGAVQGRVGPLGQDIAWSERCVAAFLFLGPRALVPTAFAATFSGLLGYPRGGLFVNLRGLWLLVRGARVGVLFGRRGRGSAGFLDRLEDRTPTAHASTCRSRGGAAAGVAGIGLRLCGFLRRG